MIPVYQRLRQYRERKGITQTYIARKTGKTRQRISALESGGIRLSADELEELCIKGYGVNPSIFFPKQYQSVDGKKARL